MSELYLLCISMIFLEEKKKIYSDISTKLSNYLLEFKHIEDRRRCN